MRDLICRAYEAYWNAGIFSIVIPITGKCSKGWCGALSTSYLCYEISVIWTRTFFTLSDFLQTSHPIYSISFLSMRHHVSCDRKICNFCWVLAACVIKWGLFYWSVYVSSQSLILINCIFSSLWDLASHEWMLLAYVLVSV